MSIGATPPANGDALTWASTVKDSPLPFQKTVTSIANIFDETFLNNSPLRGAYDIHQIQEIRTLINFLLQEYCSELRRLGKIGKIV